MISVSFLDRALPIASHITELICENQLRSPETTEVCFLVSHTGCDECITLVQSVMHLCGVLQRRTEPNRLL